MWSRMMQHVSIASKVEPGDEGTLPREILLVNLGYL